MAIKFVEKFFGTHSQRELKMITPLVDKVESLRPQMQRHDIDRATVLHDAGPSRAVRHHAVGLLAHDPLDVLDRVFRGNHLREIVAVTAHVPILVAVARRQFAQLPTR